MDKLNQFFGQDTKREDEYRDFERRYRENPDSISDEEAARRYREMAQHDDMNDMDDPDTEAEYERGGGVEDPRLVEIGGLFYLTYTAYNGKDAQLALAGGAVFFVR